jgi:hypothetical protein
MYDWKTMYDAQYVVAKMRLKSTSLKDLIDERFAGD